MLHVRVVPNPARTSYTFRPGLGGALEGDGRWLKKKRSPKPGRIFETVERERVRKLCAALCCVCEWPLSSMVSSWYVLCPARAHPPLATSGSRRETTAKSSNIVSVFNWNTPCGRADSVGDPHPRCLSATNNTRVVLLEKLSLQLKDPHTTHLYRDEQVARPPSATLSTVYSVVLSS